jgi:predicted acyl esterase
MTRPRLTCARCLLVPLLAAVLALCLLSPARAQQQPAVQTYMVPMSDGVQLATDVRPGRGEGPWPVVLLRTPYSKKVTIGGLDDYAIVTQDVRGRFDSEGHARPFFDDGWGEHQDGLDTVKWILAQPWCNGKIGTTGGSALGITQEMLAGANPPAVLCQHIVVATGDIYRHAAYPGAAFRESLMAGWLKETKWPEDNLALMLEHPFYDALWQTTNSDARIRAERINIPAVHLGGWFDIFTQGTLDSFIIRSRIRPEQWLVMGPWPHGIKREVGELEFPPNAVEVPKPGTDFQMWFDHWLRGTDNGLPMLPRVQYYVMGACGEPGAPGNEWRSAYAWPVHAKRTRFYLGPEQSLSRMVPAAGRATYRYDPAKPVPTRGGANLLLPAGPMDQRELETRKDVLVFSTPVLEEPVEVTGRVIVRLYASSSARDTMFTAKLCDVYPDGRSMLLCDGALRAACRASLSNASPLEPGRVYEFNVDLGSTSIIFNKGHRIRVDISSSNAPRFAVHPNVWGEGKAQTATQTVYHGGTNASAVILPVVGGQ